MQGTPTLAANRSGRYEIRYAEKLPNGKTRSRTQTTGTSSLNEAKIVLSEFLRHEQAIAKALHNPTIQDLAGDYKRAAQARGVTASTFVSLAHVTGFFGGFTPSEIAPSDFLRFRVSRNVSDSTLRKDLAALKSVLSFGVKHRLIAQVDVPYVDLPPAGQPRDVWLNETQEAEFLELAHGHSLGLPRLSRLTRFVSIALDAAARKSAIEGLTWDRVDLDKRLIDFREPGLRRTKKRRVPVPISDRLAPVLERAKREATGGFVLDHGGDIRKTFNTWRQAIGYAWVSPHVMRHTAATLMLRAGVSIWSVAGVLGDTVETVTRTYGHHDPEYLVNAVNRRA